MLPNTVVLKTSNTPKAGHVDLEIDVPWIHGGNAERVLDVDHHDTDALVSAMLRHQVDCIVDGIADAREHYPLRGANQPCIEAVIRSRL